MRGRVRLPRRGVVLLFMVFLSGQATLRLGVLQNDMKIRMVAGLLVVISGVAIQLLCNRTIRELSGLGVAPPPLDFKYPVGSHEWWDYQLDYFWLVRPFLPADYDVTTTPTDLPVLEGKRIFYGRVISASRVLRRGQYYAGGLIVLGAALIWSACIAGRRKLKQHSDGWNRIAEQGG